MTEFYSFCNSEYLHIHKKMPSVCEYLKIYNYKRSFDCNFIFDFLILSSRIALKFSLTCIVKYPIISKEFIVLLHIMIKAATSACTLGQI